VDGFRARTETGRREHNGGGSGRARGVPMDR
jgi:hypothetical protein